MKGLGSFALPIVGLAVFVTVAKSGHKPRNVDEVYALLEDRLHSLELRLEDTERSLNSERIRSRSLEAKVTRLERERKPIPVVKGKVCGVSCELQLHNLRSGIIAEKHKAFRADKAVIAMKSRLQNISTRLEAVELDSHRLVDRENKTIKMIDIIRRRSDDLSTKLRSISLKAEGAMTNSYQTNQTVQELKAVIGNQSVRIDVTDRKCDSLMKRTNHTDQTGTRNTTAREDHMEQGIMADYLRRATEVEGPPTSRHGGWSIATCPGTTTVVGCRCSHEDRACVGVYVEGQACWAYKSYQGSNPIQARAKCIHGGSFVVTQDTEDGPRSPRPVARCPSHTRVAVCWLINWDENQPYMETRLDRGDNSCTVSEPCEASLCGTQALCLVN